MASLEAADFLDSAVALESEHESLTENDPYSDLFNEDQLVIDGGNTSRIRERGFCELRWVPEKQNF
ncbi:MAG: hypothetical protein MK538_04975 [Planctomycetes bacterium]|nr:hypothetical protein [Planctomycetota bacterium]